MADHVGAHLLQHALPDARHDLHLDPVGQESSEVADDGQTEKDRRTRDVGVWRRDVIVDGDFGQDWPNRHQRRLGNGHQQYQCDIQLERPDVCQGPTRQTRIVRDAVLVRDVGQHAGSSAAVQAASATSAKTAVHHDDTSSFSSTLGSNKPASRSGASCLSASWLAWMSR